MKKFRILILAVLLTAAIVGAWRYFLHNPQRMIRARIDRVARLASFRADEPPASRLLNVKQLAECFLPDAQVRVGMDEASPRAIEGRAELQQAALMARSSLNGLVLEFKDVSVEVAPDRQAATARMTARLSVPGEKDLTVQELKMDLSKSEGAWLIGRVESVKTLSLPGAP